MNVEVYRGTGDNPAPQEIFDPVLTTDDVGRFRLTNELNENDSSRIFFDGDGPKGGVLIPTKLAEINSREERRRGIVEMYARTYNQDDNEYTINSHMTIETKA